MTARTEPQVLDDYEEGEHQHPSDLTYFYVALALAALTGIEILIYLTDIDFLVLAGGLVILMSIKFGLVITYFMHLRFDNRIFRRVFLTGVFLAILVYLAVLMMFHVFLR
jgi:cytochrome c oxidase subunit 4